MTRRYVSKARAVAPSLPKDQWMGGVFREADGTEMIVMWNGDKRAPSICQIERGHANWRKTGHPVTMTI